MRGVGVAWLFADPSPVCTRTYHPPTIYLCPVSVDADRHVSFESVPVAGSSFLLLGRRSSAYFPPGASGVLSTSGIVGEVSLQVRPLFSR